MNERWSRDVNSVISHTPCTSPATSARGPSSAASRRVHRTGARTRYTAPTTTLDRAAMGLGA
jgi:hypothetical protein